MIARTMWLKFIPVLLALIAAGVGAFVLFGAGEGEEPFLIGIPSHQLAAKDGYSFLPADPAYEPGVDLEFAQDYAATHYPNVDVLQFKLGRLVTSGMGRDSDKMVWFINLDPADPDNPIGRRGGTLSYALRVISAETGEFVFGMSSGQHPAGGGPIVKQPLSPPASIGQ